MNGVTIKRLFREKIEIDRSSVSKPLCNSGPAVQGVTESGGGPKFRPELLLRRRQDVHARLEGAAHSNLRDGMAGTRSTLARPSR